MWLDVTLNGSTSTTLRLTLKKCLIKAVAWDVSRSNTSWPGQLCLLSCPYHITRKKEAHCVTTLGCLTLHPKAQLAVCWSANSVDGRPHVWAGAWTSAPLHSLLWTEPFISSCPLWRVRKGHLLLRVSLPLDLLESLLFISGLATSQQLTGKITWYFPLSRMIILSLIFSACSWGIGEIWNRSDDNIASGSEARNSLKCRLDSVVIVLGIWWH